VPVSEVNKKSPSPSVSGVTKTSESSSRKEVQLPPIQATNELKNLNTAKSIVSFDVEDKVKKKPSFVVPNSLTQTELAYRLGVHATTVSKWKMRGDFMEWSKSKIPPVWLGNMK